MNNSHDNRFNDLQQDDEVIARVRAIFKTACEQADSYHTLRLGLARRKAIHAGGSHSVARMFASMAGAAIACCALAVGIVLMRPAGQTASPADMATSGTIPSDATATVDELPEVGSGQMEMVQDLDFYRWLASQPKAAGAAARGTP